MEVLSAISIIAVVTSIALPSVNGFFASQQASAAAKSFLANVRLARYEAIRMGVPTRLILSDLASNNQYQVQMFTFNAEDTVSQADSLDTSNWVSILDKDTEEIDPSISISIGNHSPIYFTPEGLVTDDPWVIGSTPLPMAPRPIHFCYRDTATMTIYLTGSGGISSVEFYEEQ
jgi:Tfp pilus assembly protein FimT